MGRAENGCSEELLLGKTVINGCPGFAGTEPQTCHGLQATSHFESARAADPSWLTAVSRTINVTVYYKSGSLLGWRGSSYLGSSFS